MAFVGLAQPMRVRGGCEPPRYSPSPDFARQASRWPNGHHQAASDFSFGPFAQGLTEASKSPQTTQAEHEPNRSGSTTAQT
jgi:hypothetical protein